jgi:hypothetical protein
MEEKHMSIATNRIVAELKAEVEKLQSVIAILEGEESKQSSTKKKSKFSAETRKRMSRKMRAAWKKRKAAKVKVVAKPVAVAAKTATVA